MMMKRIVKMVAAGILLSVMVCIVTSCEKAPVNSKIEGHWILQRFTVLETGEVTECERLFWGITYVGTKMFEKQGPHGYKSIEARTEYRNNEKTFVLKNFCLDGTTTKASVEDLLPYGINSQEEAVFDVVKSTNKRLVLESDYARLELKKF